MRVRKDSKLSSIESATVEIQRKIVNLFLGERQTVLGRQGRVNFSRRLQLFERNSFFLEDVDFSESVDFLGEADTLFGGTDTFFRAAAICLREWT